MSTKYSSEVGDVRTPPQFNDKYVFVNNHNNIRDMLARYRMAATACSAFVLLGEAEVLELWASEYEIAYNNRTYERVI